MSTTPAKMDGVWCKLWLYWKRRQVGFERFKVRGNTVRLFRNYRNIVKPESRRDRWYSCPEGPYRFWPV